MDLLFNSRRCRETKHPIARASGIAGKRFGMFLCESGSSENDKSDLHHKKQDDPEFQYQKKLKYLSTLMNCRSIDDPQYIPEK
jgi:hypothetical protein